MCGPGSPAVNPWLVAWAAHRYRPRLWKAEACHRRLLINMMPMDLVPSSISHTPSAPSTVPAVRQVRYSIVDCRDARRVFRSHVTRFVLRWPSGKLQSWAGSISAVVRSGCCASSHGSGLACRPVLSTAGRSCGNNDPSMAMTGADRHGNRVVEATDERIGEKFIVRADHLYTAVVELAQQIGLDLEDGKAYQDDSRRCPDTHRSCRWPFAAVHSALGIGDPAGTSTLPGMRDRR